VKAASFPIHPPSCWGHLGVDVGCGVASDLIDDLIKPTSATRNRRAERRGLGREWVDRRLAATIAVDFSTFI